MGQMAEYGNSFYNSFNTSLYSQQASKLELEKKTWFIHFDKYFDRFFKATNIDMIYDGKIFIWTRIDKCIPCEWLEIPIWPEIETILFDLNEFS